MSNRQDIRERRRKQKQQQRTVVIMVVAGVALIGAALIMLPFIRSSVATVGNFVTPDFAERPMADGNAMGDPNAPVQLVNYSDFGCSHCAAFTETTELKIMEDYVASGKVYFVSRSVGNLLGNPKSQSAAEANYCAADQNKYWEFHDIVFANQITLFSNPATNIEPYLQAFAEELDLDMDAFNTCFESGTYRSRVLQDGADANAAGINSTPSFVLNGQLIVPPGNLPYEEFQIRIEQALATADN